MKRRWYRQILPISLAINLYRQLNTIVNIFYEVQNKIERCQSVLHDRSVEKAECHSESCGGSDTHDKLSP